MLPFFFRRRQVFSRSQKSCKSVCLTRRKSPNGLTRFVHTIAQWLQHFTCSGLPVCTDSPTSSWRIFRAFSLVVSCSVPGAWRGADVFRYGGLSPLFRAPFV